MRSREHEAFPGDIDTDRELGRIDRDELVDVLEPGPWPRHSLLCYDDEGRLLCCCGMADHIDRARELTRNDPETRY